VAQSLWSTPVTSPRSQQQQQQQQQQKSIRKTKEEPCLLAFILELDSVAQVPSPLLLHKYLEDGMEDRYGN
jgi:hypothetical protein